jgi:uncharacterized protein YcfJ
MTKHKTKRLKQLLGVPNTMVMLTGLACFGLIGLAQAQDAARVISRTANLQQVLVPSSYCAQRLAPAPAVHAERSNAGAIVGAIAGGLLGSTVGRGDGRVAAAAIGAATGAIIGDRVDNAPAAAGSHLGTAAPITQAGGEAAVAITASPVGAPGAVTITANPVAAPGAVAPIGPLPAAPAIICQGSQALETRVAGYTVVYEYAGRQYSAQLNRDPGETLPLVITPDPSYLMAAPLTTYAPIDQRRRRY